MIPIKNKKKPLEATVEEMRKFSLSYLDKYTPSKQQLKTYLLKKYLNKSILNIKKELFENRSESSCRPKYNLKLIEKS